ncbi:hypothetical protein ACFO3J_31120 [Streptomyces polygonati]|uniref:DNA topoisomerase type IIA subunit B domain-containing protein n=1 Tax=Streptomyces polygonati TaxID=1617087 RepID=A0ABV8HV47_9ACTN
MGARRPQHRSHGSGSSRSVRHQCPVEPPDGPSAERRNSLGAAVHPRHRGGPARCRRTGGRQRDHHHLLARLGDLHDRRVLVHGAGRALQGSRLPQPGPGNLTDRRTPPGREPRTVRFRSPGGARDFVAFLDAPASRPVHPDVIGFEWEDQRMEGKAEVALRWCTSREERVRSFANSKAQPTAGSATSHFATASQRPSRTTSAPGWRLTRSRRRPPSTG